MNNPNNCESFPSAYSKSQPWKKDWPPTLKASTVGDGVQGGGGTIGEKLYNLGSGIPGDWPPPGGKLFAFGSEPGRLVLNEMNLRSISPGLTTSVSI